MWGPRISLQFVCQLRPALEALAVGLVIGLIDIHHSGDGGFGRSAFLVAGAVLGLRHAGRALPCWPILGVSLYVVHVVAIASGKKQPYVEENYRFSEQCLLNIVPAGLGIMGGAGLRVALAASGSFKRKNGPPVRFFPRTTREMIVMVACLAVSLAGMKRVLSPPTIYSEVYNEDKFRSIRKGMTQQQVLSTMGQPLLKQPNSDSYEIWQYSDQYTYTSNYERRWVIFDRGTVQQVVNDYWYD